MATNHTTNYALNLWEPTDSFVREEFNENTSKIDEALAGKLGRGIDLYTSPLRGQEFGSGGYATLTHRMVGCEYYAIAVEFPYRDQDKNKTFELYFHGHESELMTFPARSFIMLFFPHGDITGPFRCLVLCDTPRYLIFDGTYEANDSFHLQVSNDQKVPDLIMRFIGWK